MQAPRTPASPGEKPETRGCPSCGAANGVLAAFCWQCYAAFGAAPVAASALPTAPARGLRGPALEQPVPILPAERTTTSRFKPAVGAVLVGILASMAVAWMLNRPADAELPEAFGGLNQIHDPRLETILEAFTQQADQVGFSGELALYGGAGTVPTAALAWVSDGSTAPVAEGFEEFADGFDTGLGTGSLDRAGRVDETIEGIDYLCAPVDAQPPATLCMWQEDAIYWILYDLSGADVDTAQTLAVSATAATRD